jgi:hypothetical protein
MKKRKDAPNRWPPHFLHGEHGSSIDKAPHNCVSTTAALLGAGARDCVWPNLARRVGPQGCGSLLCLDIVELGGKPEGAHHAYRPTPTLTPDPNPRPPTRQFFNQREGRRRTHHHWSAAESHESYWNHWTNEPEEREERRGQFWRAERKLFCSLLLIYYYKRCKWPTYHHNFEMFLYTIVQSFFYLCTTSINFISNGS